MGHGALLSRGFCDLQPTEPALNTLDFYHQGRRPRLHPGLHRGLSLPWSCGATSSAPLLSSALHPLPQSCLHPRKHLCSPAPKGKSTSPFHMKNVALNVCAATDKGPQRSQRTWSSPVLVVGRLVSGPRAPSQLLQLKAFGLCSGEGSSQDSPILTEGHLEGSVAL